MRLLSRTLSRLTQPTPQLPKPSAHFPAVPYVCFVYTYSNMEPLPRAFPWLPIPFASHHIAGPLHISRLLAVGSCGLGSDTSGKYLATSNGGGRTHAGSGSCHGHAHGTIARHDYKRAHVHTATVLAWCWREHS